METIVDRPIEKDMKESYLDYSMSVIVGRALPDVRDGLKPVHRRILYAMYELGNSHDKPYKKSARVVGETLGKYHPHGDVAIYDTLVRMAQPFSLRYPLVDGQGNFGSIDGDRAAAMRYTEVRMKKIADEMLQDIDKETIKFIPNFDGTLKEPLVFPSKIPNLIINGSAGIAVGMATNIPPHNLVEIVDGINAIIDGADEEKIFQIISGPDFPTGGTIVGRSGIREAYKNGRGIIRLRGKCEIRKDKNGKELIAISEIPYQVTKTSIIEYIVEAVKNKRIEGISGIHDRSDKDGIEVIIDLKRDAVAEVIVNQLYAHTPLESTFGIINLVLVNNEPKTLGICEILRLFIEFRKEMVTLRTKFELKVAEERAHILEGLRKALDNIDAVVAFLRKTKDVESARAGLMKEYTLSDRQANAILDMKMQRLIALEREKIDREYDGLIKTIEELKGILADVNKVLAIIKRELAEVKEKYGDARRTDIIEAVGERLPEELIPNETVVLTITNRGYIKRVGLDEYRAQKRGGKGVVGAGTKEEDIISDMMVTKNHDNLLFFSNLGRIYWLKAYEVPEGGRYATGKPIVNLIQMQEQNEKITSWISVQEFTDKEYLSMITKNGIIKRISLDNFARPRRGGIIAITLKEKDELVSVLKTDGKQDILIATMNGQAIRFNEVDAREIGRTGQGVIGIRFKEGEDKVVGAAVCSKPSIMTMTENGYGKRTSIDEYRVQGRGGSGVINIKTEGRNGHVVDVRAIDDSDEIIVISSKGQTIRSPVSGISVIGRNTQGVRIIRLDDNEKVASFTSIKKEEVIEKAAEEKTVVSENQDE
ncbi:MAG: DNA gyrase subunit A [Candidatus Micrarchaeia archaeon]